MQSQLNLFEEPADEVIPDGYPIKWCYNVRYSYGVVLSSEMDGKYRRYRVRANGDLTGYSEQWIYSWRIKEQ